MFGVLSTHFVIVLTTIYPYSPNLTLSSQFNQSPAMATIPSHDSRAEFSVIFSPPADVPVAKYEEYKAAVTAYEEHLNLLDSTRKKYNALFLRHKEAETRHGKHVKKIKSQGSTFLLHKQYFASLSNALLASNATLRSAPKPISDLQALNHATLCNDIRLASYTLTGMIYKNKRLEKAYEMTWMRDQGLQAKCEEMFKLVERDCMELDQRHAKVLDLEKEMGSESGCPFAEKCISCRRNKEKEERKAAMIEQEAKEQEAAKEQKGVNGKVSARNVKKGAGLKGRLEDIVEEEVAEDKAGK